MNMNAKIVKQNGSEDENNKRIVNENNNENKNRNVNTNEY